MAHPWLAVSFLTLLLLLSTPSPSHAKGKAKKPQPSLSPPLPTIRKPTPTNPLPPAVQALYSSSQESSTATFYGSASGIETFNAACGYGDANATGYGLLTAAMSAQMWSNGAICGSCYQVTCQNSKYCKPGKSVVVTITNICPKGSEGGWCDPPNHHLDMSVYAWGQIAGPYIGGVVPTSMVRVPCSTQGGIKFALTGNQWWTNIVVMNVGGSGDIVSLEVSVDGGGTWQAFTRDWGENWTGGGLVGNSLSFRMKTGLVPDTLVAINAIPNTWMLGGTYAISQNFPRVPAAATTKAKSGAKSGAVLRGNRHNGVHA